MNVNDSLLHQLDICASVPSNVALPEVPPEANTISPLFSADLIPVGLWVDVLTNPFSLLHENWTFKLTT